jgi:hypothetical protein
MAKHSRSIHSKEEATNALDNLYCVYVFRHIILLQVLELLPNSWYRWVSLAATYTILLTVCTIYVSTLNIFLNFKYTT